jgi:hypothetical protein
MYLINFFKVLKITYLIAKEMIFVNMVLVLTFLLKPILYHNLIFFISEDLASKNQLQGYLCIEKQDSRNEWLTE